MRRNKPGDICLKTEKTVAIIGAGMAGISLAKQLRDTARVTVFEKSRGYGGRLSVRRHADWQFDHGAQFFTARSVAFQQQVSALLASGVIAPWEPRVLTVQAGQKPYKRPWYEAHYVAVPGMSDVVKHLAADIDVHLQTRVSAIHRFRQGWLLQDEEGQELGQFDLVVTALPAPQCHALMPEQFAGQAALAAVSYSPCFALMLGFGQKLTLNFGAAVVRESPLAWIAVQDSKPGREDAACLLLHSANRWAASMLEHDAVDIQVQLLNALREVTDIELPDPEHIALHRWRYARVEGENFPGVLLDANQGWLPAATGAMVTGWKMPSSVDTAWVRRCSGYSATRNRN